MPLSKEQKTLPGGIFLHPENFLPHFQFNIKILIMNEESKFNLERFKSAQEHSYEKALTEIKHGHKRSHWMWFIFPQIEG